MTALHLLLITGLSFPGVISAEDAFIGFNAGDVSLITTAQLLVPGRTFVLTVAYHPPSPEDAVVRRVPVNCKPAKVRVDTHTISPGNNSIGIELGPQQTVGVGKVYQFRHSVAPRVGSDFQALRADLVAFRIRADTGNPHCQLSFSGLLHEGPNSGLMPKQIQFAPTSNPKR